MPHPPHYYERGHHLVELRKRVRKLERAVDELPPDVREALAGHVANALGVVRRLDARVSDLYVAHVRARKNSLAGIGAPNGH